MIALGPDEGEALWFLGELVTIKASGEATAGRVAVSEQFAPHGAGPPLHIHPRKDGWFYVLEGELTLWVGGESVVAPAGSFAYCPRDIAHTFSVTSDTARFLVVNQPAGFEAFTRAVGEPAARPELPTPTPASCEASTLRPR